MRRIITFVGTVYHGLKPETNYRAYISIVGTFNFVVVLLFLLLDTTLSTIGKTVMPSPDGGIYLLCVIALSIITIYLLLPEKQLASVAVNKEQAKYYAKRYLLGFLAISILLIVAIVLIK